MFIRKNESRNKTEFEEVKDNKVKIKHKSDTWFFFPFSSSLFFLWYQKISPLESISHEHKWFMLWKSGIQRAHHRRLHLNLENTPDLFTWVWAVNGVLLSCSLAASRHPRLCRMTHDCPAADPEHTKQVSKTQNDVFLTQQRSESLYVHILLGEEVFNATTFDS